ncbi:hypothetical protein BGZ61DRAFT_458872 [Ilyonectria robusta]|uniref:uncharacterized protein n=1 Tax=Ilyonectria robusta TaxID=1079257 RepID=UPI001E8D3C4F|nr:uncharacterized protein BGZ61DRAFT_458872 [Ilyonectria robusta]KAH8673138.1 hypothetical protein BGZ61DRAFT_458872 [Ilyonectria robusta]
MYVVCVVKGRVPMFSNFEPIFINKSNKIGITDTKPKDYKMLFFTQVSHDDR